MLLSIKKNGYLPLFLRKQYLKRKLKNYEKNHF